MCWVSYESSLVGGRILLTREVHVVDSAIESSKTKLLPLWLDHHCDHLQSKDPLPPWEHWTFWNCVGNYGNMLNSSHITHSTADTGLTWVCNRATTFCHSASVLAVKVGRLPSAARPQIPTSTSNDPIFARLAFCLRPYNSREDFLNSFSCWLNKDEQKIKCRL